MAGKAKAKSNRKDTLDHHARRVRRNQAIFSFVAVLLILSMALSVVVYLK